MEPDSRPIRGHSRPFENRHSPPRSASSAALDIRAHTAASHGGLTGSRTIHLHTQREIPVRGSRLRVTMAQPAHTGTSGESTDMVHPLRSAFSPHSLVVHPPGRAFPEKRRPRRSSWCDMPARRAAVACLHARGGTVALSCMAPGLATGVGQTTAPRAELAGSLCEPAGMVPRRTRRPLPRGAYRWASAGSASVKSVVERTHSV